MHDDTEKVDRRVEIDQSIFANGLSEVYDERVRDHISNTLNRLPEHDLDYLLYNKVMRVIQPVVNTVLVLDDLNLSMRDAQGRITLIVFHSALCDKPEYEITYTIAHEFAHVFLGHATNDSNVDRECEKLADRQVVEWGFEEELKKTPYNYLYGEGRFV